jgi:hypothetical protein
MRQKTFALVQLMQPRDGERPCRLGDLRVEAVNIDGWIVASEDTDTRIWIGLNGFQHPIRGHAVRPFIMYRSFFTVPDQHRLISMADQILNSPEQFGVCYLHSRFAQAITKNRRNSSTSIAISAAIHFLSRIKKTRTDQGASQEWRS